MGYNIIISIIFSSICYLFFINSITRGKITFKRHIKRMLFNIGFFIEGGSIRIKESSRNMNCMRKLLIMINFIRECRGQEILIKRTRGDARFAPCFIFNFLRIFGPQQVRNPVNSRMFS